MADRIEDLDGLLDEMSSELFWRNCGMSRLLHPVTGALMACFPITATDAGEWERKALAMHANQSRVDLPDKPLNAKNTLAERVKILRGD